METFIVIAVVAFMGAILFLLFRDLSRDYDEFKNQKKV